MDPYQLCNLTHYVRFQMYNLHGDIQSIDCKDSYEWVENILSPENIKNFLSEGRKKDRRTTSMSTPNPSLFQSTMKIPNELFHHHQ